MRAWRSSINRGGKERSWKLEDGLILLAGSNGQRDSHAFSLQIGGFEHIEPNPVPVNTRWP